MSGAAALAARAAADATSVGALVAGAATRLAAAGVETARLDSRLLAAQAFGVDAAHLLAHPERPATEAGRRRFEALVARRQRREPVALILGRREFWGLDFRVTKATLVPRPETETVVERALACVVDRDAALSVLDLGTGSGCLLLALLSELRCARGLGVDISAAALKVARANAERLGLGDRARFLKSDWHGDVRETFDLVVVNPPYIADGDFALLEPEVSRFEPRSALAAGADGLDAYRALVPGLARLLNPGAHVVLEVGAGQADAVATMLEGQRLAVSGVHADLAGRPRALTAMAEF